MTATHPSLLVAGLYTTYDLPMASIKGSSSGELQDLTNRLVDRSMAFGMEVST